MTKYAVFGLGMMGEAICYDLLRFTSDPVVGFEKNSKRIVSVKERLSEFGERFSPLPFDISKHTPESLSELLKNKEITVAFGAIDYSLNLLLTDACIRAGVNFLDLGGNPKIVQKQREYDESAKRIGVTVIPDCGLAPGMVNVIASGLINDFDEVDKCEIRVGGLPQSPKTSLKYQQVFSIRGLINEYLENAVVIRKGKLLEVPSLTEIETLIFPEPWGELEAFQTAGGTSSLPELFLGRIRELNYKTIRFKGHAKYFQFLKEYGFLSEENLNGVVPRQFTETLLQKYLPKDNPDAVLARITVSGRKGGKDQTVSLQLIDLMDTNTGFSAMARTTAFPISIIGQMISKGNIKMRGVIPGELAVPPNIFMKELQFRGIQFERLG